MLKIYFCVYFILMMFYCGIFSFCFNRKHLLLMLLSLEFIIMSLFSLFMIYLIYFSKEMYLSMFFLTLSVCEGALGLSLLVMIIRSYGNDFYQSFSML